MRIHPKKLAIALYEIVTESKESELETVLKNFIRFLDQKGMLSQAPKVITEFEKYYHLQQGIQTVLVETASALNQNEIKEITKELSLVTKKEIKLTNQVKPELIGGAVFRFEDILIDGSLRLRLARLHQKLISAT